VCPRQRRGHAPVGAAAPDRAGSGVASGPRGRGVPVAPGAPAPRARPRGRPPQSPQEPPSGSLAAPHEGRPRPAAAPQPAQNLRPDPVLSRPRTRDTAHPYPQLDDVRERTAGCRAQEGVPRGVLGGGGCGRGGAVAGGRGGGAGGRGGRQCFQRPVSTVGGVGRCGFRCQVVSLPPAGRHLVGDSGALRPDQTTRISTSTVDSDCVMRAGGTGPRSMVQCDGGGAAGRRGGQPVNWSGRQRGDA